MLVEVGSIECVQPLSLTGHLTQEDAFLSESIQDADSSKRTCSSINTPVPREEGGKQSSTILLTQQ